MTSSLVSRKQPADSACPMVSGSFDPWMRYMLEPRYMARAPSGLSGPPRQHLRRRRPVRPFALGADARHAAPGEADVSDANAVCKSSSRDGCCLEPVLGRDIRPKLRPRVEPATMAG